MTNTERVQTLKETAMLNYKEASRIRKQSWDTKAKQRVLQVGHLVLIRKSGMDDKLSQSWVGPFPICKVFSPLSYQVDSGRHNKQTVHVQRLKKYEQRSDSALVKRVTTVLDPDSVEDTMENTYSEVVLSGKVESESRDKDIDGWVQEYADILTKQPGLTEKATIQGNANL